MDRKVLIALTKHTHSYENAFNIIQVFENSPVVNESCHIGFSANVGKYGGFVTDDTNTYSLWLVFVSTINLITA